MPSHGGHRRRHTIPPPHAKTMHGAEWNFTTHVSDLPSNGTTSTIDWRDSERRTLSGAGPKKSLEAYERMCAKVEMELAGYGVNAVSAMKNSVYKRTCQKLVLKDLKTFCKGLDLGR